MLKMIGRVVRALEAPEPRRDGVFTALHMVSGLFTGILAAEVKEHREKLAGLGDVDAVLRQHRQEIEALKARLQTEVGALGDIDSVLRKEVGNLHALHQIARSRIDDAEVERRRIAQKLDAEAGAIPETMRRTWPIVLAGKVAPLEKAAETDK